MGLRGETGNYSIEQADGKKPDDEPYFMEPAGQVSLWRERLVIDPGILEEVAEMAPGGSTPTIGEPITL